MPRQQLNFTNQSHGGCWNKDLFIYERDINVVHLIIHEGAHRKKNE